jgi:hypothetical protein
MAAEMFEDAITALFAGELDEGRLLLRQYVNATRRKQTGDTVPLDIETLLGLARLLGDWTPGARHLVLIAFPPVRVPSRASVAVRCRTARLDARRPKRTCLSDHPAGSWTSIPALRGGQVLRAWNTETGTVMSG